MQNKRMQKGALTIVDCLIEQNVEYVFGYPGGYVIDIFDALYERKDKITQVLTSHEQGAAHAADGYARATGKVGVCMATSGPGATNLVTGIATAYMDSVPLVAITGNVPLSNLGRDSFQEVDIAGVTYPITKHNFIVKDANELADTIRRAFKIALSGRPGPVLVDIPKNVQQQIHEYSPEKPQKPTVSLLTESAETDKAIEIISNSSRPLIVAGGGCIISGATNELIKFAEQLKAPVCVTMMGLGGFPANHRAYIGMIGMHGHAAVAHTMGKADAIIVLGARFSDRVAGNRANFCPNAKIVHVDIDKAEIDKNVTSHAHVTGDVKQALTLITSKMRAHTQDGWLDEAVLDSKQNPLVDSGLKLCPRKILREIARQTPKDQIIATDVGQHQMWTAQTYEFNAPRTFISSGGLGTMGFGLGASIGASMGAKKSVCLITGDGSFHMNMNEIPTAVKNRLPIKIFVFNNNTLGMVRQWQTLFYDKHYSSTTLNNPTDYVKLAEAFGATGLVLDKNEDVQQIVKKAMSIDTPVIIDCRINTDEFVLPMIPAGKTNNDIITKL